MNPSRILNSLLLAGAMLSPVGMQAQSDKALAARIQKLDDVEEIRLLLLTYGRALDAHDFTTYSNLFAKDGEWVGGLGVSKGPAAIKALMEKSFPDKPGGTYHLMSNFMIDVHGDTATGWSRWTFVSGGTDKKPIIAIAGHYDDTFVREAGHWKFQRRTAPADIPFNPLDGK
jgi:uncharacterized protein (TIGR02246 family)